MNITLEAISNLVQQYYNVSGEAIRLPGEEDFNYKIKTPDGLRYIFKISPQDAELSTVDYQLQLLEHLATKAFSIQVPSLISSHDGKKMHEHQLPNGKTIFIRLYTWVDGQPIADIRPHQPELMQAWGAAQAEVAKALKDFDHPQAHAFLKWDLAHVNYSKQYVEHISLPDQRALALYFFERQDEHLQAKCAKLRSAIIHNDGNDYNVMVSFQGRQARLSGLIDFGDAIHTQLINDLAITCAYACMDKVDPLATACQLTKGFHSIYPLEAEELEVLYDQIAARLLITVCSAAYNRSTHPDNEYLSISEAPAWKVLEKWKTIHPDFAQYAFRQACDFTAHPQQDAFKNWAEINQEHFHPIINTTDKSLLPLDLSIGGKILGNYENYQSIELFEKTIANQLYDADHQIGFGGYGEHRPFYTSDTFRATKNQGNAWRTKHLGLDLWVPYKTNIYAILSGTIVRLFNDIGQGNYGPCMVLEHQWSEGKFYTLYGHLTVSTIEQYDIGQTVEAGRQLGSVGAAPENGNWPAHLHFQLILNLFDFENDFPGVAFPDESPVWMSNSPDPALLFPDYSSPALSASLDGILKKRKSTLGKNLSVSYTDPLTILRGQGQYLIDPFGQKFLDTVNNVAHAGHEHPRLVKVAHQQNGLLNTNTRYLHPNIIAYAEKLLATFPDEYEVCYFVNSGSEANELAMRMCDAYTGGQDMIAIEIGYHGNTKRCIDVSSYKFDSNGGNGKPDDTHILPLPDAYRGRYRGHSPETGEKYASHVQEALANIKARGGKLSGFIGESILSCGGQIVLPPGYLQSVYAQVRSAGGLCITDEVQVGFGRVGDHFWGFELQGVLPDIVTMGKPIGNGHPMAAVVTTHAVAEAFNNGMEFFNTFGGNPVSCAIGHELLQIIEDEKLQERALAHGQYLKAALKKLQDEFPLIGEVRGHGLFLGIEFIRDLEKMIPADWETAYIANRMREQGVLMSTDGPQHNILKIKPPMCIEQSDLDYLLERLRMVLRETVLQ